jgi:predicted phage tail protein
MISALLLFALHIAAPVLSDRARDDTSHVGWLTSSEAQATRHARITELDEQLSHAPTGWPVGAVIGAAVSFGLTGVIGASALVLMFAFTGAEGAGVVLGTIVALVGIFPLAAAIVFVVIGVSAANQRASTVEQLRLERRALVEQEEAASLAPRSLGPLLVVARF